MLGGVAWERFPIDPYPGPRSADQILGGRRLTEATVLADERTTTPEGVPFAESRMAGFICSQTVLVDVTPSPERIAEALAQTVSVLGCDLVVFLDVGGDALAHGDEAGLASPLCDAVMLAAAVRMAPEIAVIGAVYGAGCDGELTVDEVLDQISDLAGAGAMLGSWGLTPAVATQIEAAAAVIPTEASLLGAHCARGDTRDVLIRGGRRMVKLSPVGAITFFFDPVAAFEAALPLANAVAGAADLNAANETLRRMGVSTELELERNRAKQVAGDLTAGD